MKTTKGILLSLTAVVLFFTPAFGGGDAEKGKALFNDPHFADGKAGISCNACHPDGKKAAKGADKDKKELKKIINSCIVNALKGKPIDPVSSQMDDLIAYLESVKAQQ